MEHHSYEERLRELELFSLEKRFWADLIVVLQNLQRAYKSAGKGLLAREWRDRTTGNGFKLTEGRVRWAIRKKFFLVRVVRPWHRLSRETVAAPSLEAVEAR